MNRHRRSSRSRLATAREWGMLAMGFGGLGYERFISEEPRWVFVGIWLALIGGRAFLFQRQYLLPLLTGLTRADQQPAALPPAEQDTPTSESST